MPIHCSANIVPRQADTYICFKYFTKMAEVGKTKLVANLRNSQVFFF